MIPQDLLEILVCPVCKKPLALKDEGQGLKCAECRRVYPVRDGHPHHAGGRSCDRSFLNPA